MLSNDTGKGPHTSSLKHPANRFSNKDLLCPGARLHRHGGLALGSARSRPYHHTGLWEEQDSVSPSRQIQEHLSEPKTDTGVRRKIYRSPVSGPLSQSVEADGQAQGAEASAFHRRVHQRHS